MVVTIDNVEDADAVQRAGVERLPARGWIEGRAIEHDSRPRFNPIDLRHRRIELPERRLCVVEAFGHGALQVNLRSGLFFI
jgi:hypothetical protein